MGMSANEARTSLVFVLPHGGIGRRKNFGTIGIVEGHQVMCLGYTADGKNVVYAQLSQLKQIGVSIDRATRDPFYRLLRRLMSRYEVGNEKAQNGAQGSGYWGGTRGARARRKGAVTGPMGSIAPKSLSGI